MMLVLLAAIIMAISAWFTQYKTVTANNISVQAVATEIDIAPCIKTYNANGTVKTDGPGQFGPNVLFDIPKEIGNISKDCTGDGMNMIIPQFNVTNDSEKARKNDGKEVNENAAPSSAVSNLDVLKYEKEHPGVLPEDYPEQYQQKQYYDFEFYIRSKNKAINISPDSVVISATELEGNLIDSYSATKKSAYGDFNVDGLVGAVRVALIGEYCTSVTQHVKDGTNEILIDDDYAPTTQRSKQVRQLFWVPRPDVFLEVNPDTGNIDDWHLRTGRTEGITYTAPYYLRNNSGGVDKITDDSSVVFSSGTSIQKVNDDKTNTIKSLGQTLSITEFGEAQGWNPVKLLVDTTGVQDNYYVVKYTLRVWIEGADSEARRAMDGGEFSIRLKFA